MSLTTEELAQIVNVSGLKAALKASGNKGVYNFATCSTAAGTAAKVIDTAPTSFSLKTGAVIIVKFTNAITVASATLKVGSSGTAKAIYYRGAALAANKVAAGAQLMLRYNGTQYDIIGDLDTNTNAVTSVVGQTGAVTTAQVATALTNAGYKLTDANTTYKFTIGSTTKGDSTNGTDLGTLKSETAASGGTTLSLVTTGEKATWNNKGTYSKPSGGIPKTDLSSAVQTSLDAADSALQAGFGASKSTVDNTDAIRLKDNSGNEKHISYTNFLSNLVPLFFQAQEVSAWNDFSKSKTEAITFVTYIEGSAFYYQLNIFAAEGYGYLIRFLSAQSPVIQVKAISGGHSNDWKTVSLS